MKAFLLLAVSIFLFIGICEAKQQYNPFTNQWETVPDDNRRQWNATPYNSDWQPRYNSFDNTWSIQPQQAKLEYNPYTNRWEWQR